VLFAGGRRVLDVKQARSGLASAEASREAQRWSLDLAVKQRYFDVLAARESETAALARVQQAEQQLRVSLLRLRAARATRSDSLRSDIQLRNAQLALEQARTDLVSANAGLARAVGVTYAVTASDSLPDGPAGLALDEAGLARDDAYRIVQRAAAAAWDEGASFRERITADPQVRAVLDEAAIAALFDPVRFLRNLGPMFERLEKLRVMLPNLDRTTLYDLAMSSWTPWEIDSLLGTCRARETSPQSGAPSFADQMAHCDLRHFLPDDILVKVDRTTMACGLEGREPLLDHRVAEFALRLPHAMRRGALGPKHLLRKSLRRFVDKTADVTPAHIQQHRTAQQTVLARDHGRALHRSNVGQLCQGNRRPGWRRDGDLAQGLRTPTKLRRITNPDGKAAAAFDRDGEIGFAYALLDFILNRFRVDAVACGGGAINVNVDVRRAANLFGIDVLGARHAEHGPGDAA